MMSLIDSITALPLQEQLQLLDQAVDDLLASRYLDAAAVTCMLYDILITINQERSLIWPARWSFGKILYFATRYPVAIEEVLWLVYAINMKASEPFCKFEAYFGVWSTLIFLIPLQIVVVLRVIAIWDRRRPIIIILWFSLIVTDITILVTLSRVMHAFDYSMNDLLRPILGCQSGLISLSPTISVPAWAAVIVFDTVLFALTLAKALHSYKHTRTHLIKVLLRDGFAYYSVMLALGISNLILLSALPTRRAGIATALTPVLRCSYSIIGSRIVLNLRGAASHFQRDKPQNAVRLVELSGSSGSGSSSGSQQQSRAEVSIHVSQGTSVTLGEWGVGTSPSHIDATSHV